MGWLLACCLNLQVKARALSEVGWLVGWLFACLRACLLDVPATCWCTSVTGALRQLYVLPH